MRYPVHGLILLGLSAFSLATVIQPEFERWDGGRSGSREVMTIAFGESRKMFARHLYAKADAYFHSGYYPSIFDRDPKKDRLVKMTAAGEGGEDCSFLGPPRDWLARFSRHFTPSVHRHLGDGSGDHAGCAGHDHGDDPDHDHAGCSNEHGEEGRAGEQREMLPWLKLAAEMDPKQPETYVVAAYWLRSHLGKVDEAEAFVRNGLRANPSHPQLLFELGRIHEENRGRTNDARNVWELALVNFDQFSDEEKDRQLLLHAQLLGNLARLEEAAGHPLRALEYLTRLQKISPSPGRIQAWIDLVREAARTGTQEERSEESPP